MHSAFPQYPAVVAVQVLPVQVVFVSHAAATLLLLRFGLLPSARYATATPIRACRIAVRAAYQKHSPLPHNGLHRQGRSHNKR